MSFVAITLCVASQWVFVVVVVVVVYFVTDSVQKLSDTLPYINNKVVVVVKQKKSCCLHYIIGNSINLEPKHLSLSHSNRSLRKKLHLHVSMYKNI
jgi:hypothetical protein